MQSIKEHNLKANHNLLIFICEFRKSVCNLSKNTIWKQITTQTRLVIHLFLLYAIYQRTQSESKSQHWLVSWLFVLVCMQSIKEHNLKANHNFKLKLPFNLLSVCNLSKNTIWKQITTMVCCALCFVVCMQSIKEHNLKANHNKYKCWLKHLHLYAIYQRTQSESKSQLSPDRLKPLISVCNLSKNTIWKQITTI